MTSFFYLLLYMTSIILKRLGCKYANCTLISDRSYLFAEIQLNLFKTYNEKLNMLMRNN